MLAALYNWFILLIYQPLFNLVVFFYWALDRIGLVDGTMGIAVILLTIVIRLLLLPQSLHSIKSEIKRLNLAKDSAKLDREFGNDPIELASRKKALLRSNPVMIIGEILNLILQVLIAIMLWRMFSTGLTGEDVEMIYSFMPAVSMPFNLEFYGIMLDQPSLITNLTLMVLLFIMETLSVMAAIPGSQSRSRAIKAQLLLPIVSFCFFYFMPAGKQLFVITTVIFSIILTAIRLVLVRLDLYRQKQELKQAATDEQILVDTK